MFGDDLSLDGSPLGDDDARVPTVEPPVEVHPPVEPRGRESDQQEESLSLPERMREMSVEDKRGDAPDGCPVTASLEPLHMLSRAAEE